MKHNENLVLVGFDKKKHAVAYYIVIATSG